MNDLCDEIYNLINPLDVLIIKSTTTGDFLNKLFTDKTNVTRIIYKSFHHMWGNPHEDALIINSEDLINTMKNIDKKYDLICIDSLHLFEISNRDYKLMMLYLTDNGIMISHDCSPPNPEITGSNFIIGEWMGFSYVSFVKLSYENPGLYFCVLDYDFGLGIVSKTNSILPYLRKDLNRILQKELLDIFNDGDKVKIFNFFNNNAHEIINRIN